MTALKIELVATPDTLPRQALVVLGAYSDGSLTESARLLSEAMRTRMSALVREGELASAVGANITLFGLAAEGPERVVLVSLGAGAPLTETGYRTVLTAAARLIADTVMPDALVTLSEVEVADRSLAWRLEEAARLLCEARYRFSLPHAAGTRETPGRNGVRRASLVVPGPVEDVHKAAVLRGLAVAEGRAFARDVGNMPGNLATPAFLADTARQLGQRFDLSVEVFEPKDLRMLSMEALLAVVRAERSPSKLIVIGYRRGAPAARPIVLVGQGLACEGGVEWGRWGMCGAAAVLGTLCAVARLALPLNIVGLLPTAEVAADAIRRGDIVRTMSGQTIEILCPNAAGRLILCDALSYAEHFEPASVIDIATSSSTSAVALGSQASALFTNDVDLARDLMMSGLESGDRVWQFPLWEDEPSPLASTVADIGNASGPMGEAVSAACFLQRFAGHTRWAHLDIAGTAALGRDRQEASGRPVQLLSNFFMRLAGQTRPPDGRRRAAVRGSASSLGPRASPGRAHQKSI